MYSKRIVRVYFRILSANYCYSVITLVLVGICTSILSVTFYKSDRFYFISYKNYNNVLTGKHKIASLYFDLIAVLSTKKQYNQPINILTDDANVYTFLNQENVYNIIEPIIYY